MLCIQPGAPTQNAYNERFNQITRNEWLDMHLSIPRLMSSFSPRSGFGAITAND